MKIIILIILIITCNLRSKDNVSVYINPSMNYNIHSANFTNFEGISNYSYSEYGLNQSFTPNFNIGLNYKFKEKKFNLISDYSLELGLLNNSVILYREELLGNFIKEDTFYPIYSEVPIDNSINYININNIFWFDFNLPIKLGANLRLAYSISNNFSQQENALGSNEYTFENGQRTREEYEGEIPNFNKINAMLGVVIKYDIQLNRNYSISPNLSYNYALMPIASDLKWSYSNINFGIAVNYKFTEPEPKPVIPPKPPVSPTLPLPEEPKELELVFKINLTSNGSKLENNDNIILNYHHQKIQEKYSILPIIYFEENSSDLLQSNGNELFELAHNSLIENITKYLQSNVKVSITLSTGKFTLVDKELFENRINKIKDLLTNGGINQNRINFKLNQVEELNFRYEELKREEDKVSFIFDDKSNELVKFTYFENDYYTLQSDVTLDYKIEYTFNEEIISSVIYNEKPKVFSERDFSYKLNNGIELDFDNKELTAYSNPLSIRSNTMADTLKLNLDYKETSSEIITNKIDNENKSRYILGYFNFDEDKFNSIDDEVLELVKSAIANNKQITIIPMTDNIGDSLYNKELARKRGNSALNLFETNSKQNINIELNTNSFFDNKHPYGRTLNRSVIIEISN